MRLNKKMNKKFGIYTSVAVGIVVLGVALYTLLAWQTNTWPFSGSKDTLTQENLEDASQSVINAQKQKDLEHQQQAAQDEAANSSSKKQVDVVITTYTQTDTEVRVNGFANNIIEKGGACTLTLTDEAGNQVSRSRNAEVNAANTTCGQSIIPLSALHKGTWIATLSYLSNQAVGTSAPDAIPPIELK